jgi:hypothetical protein
MLRQRLPRAGEGREVVRIVGGGVGRGQCVNDSATMWSWLRTAAVNETRPYPWSSRRETFVAPLLVGLAPFVGVGEQRTIYAFFGCSTVLTNPKSTLAPACQVQHPLDLVHLAPRQLLQPRRFPAPESRLPRLARGI